MSEGSGEARDVQRDHDLIARTAQGDRDAFAELMRRHEDMVFAVCLRIMTNREAALDAVQETFITLFRKADRFRGDSSVSTWLYRVATNTCLDQLRKQRRRAADPLPEHHDPADAAAGDPFSSVELRPSIEAALATIPEEFRAAVVLSDVHGLGMDEISRILDVPVGTVKSRIYRGRRQLAEVLGNLREGSGRRRDEHA
jgi:RNA polymerase sigma-70 factor (ECF subfamily)